MINVFDMIYQPSLAFVGKHEWNPTALPPQGAFECQWKINNHKMSFHTERTEWDIFGV